MAHWAGNRNLPDAPYATNAKWPEPWQPWQRGAAQRRKRGKPTTQDLHDALRAVEEEQADIERHRTEYIIFQSILEGDLETFKETLKMSKSSTEAMAPGSGCTPIMVAAAAGEDEMCRLLLDAGANLHAQDPMSGATAFIMAANKGKVSALNTLMDHAYDVERTKHKLLQATTRKGETALMAAAKAGHVEAVKVLLDAGAALEARAMHEGHMTALHVAAAKGHTAVVMELLDRGAVLEDPDDIGMRPLMHAAAGGRSACVSALLAREPPPDLEAHDERGRTALLHAASNGFIEALEVLEARGARVGALTLGGSTGLLLACRHGHAHVANWWLSNEARRLDLNEARGSSGETPLHVAVRSGSAELVGLLLDRGALLEHKDAKGWTPLACAAAHGLLEMVQLLLARGASLLSADSRGRVPRKVADQRGHTVVAEYLRREAQRGLVKSATGGNDSDGESSCRDPKEAYLKSWRMLQGYT